MGRLTQINIDVYKFETEYLYFAEEIGLNLEFVLYLFIQPCLFIAAVGEASLWYYLLVVITANFNMFECLSPKPAQESSTRNSSHESSIFICDWSTKIVTSIMSWKIPLSKCLQKRLSPKVNCQSTTITSILFTFKLFLSSVIQN